MKRREFIKNSALSAAGLSLGASGILNAQPKNTDTPNANRPNVLLIEVDQMRFPRWTPEAKTPNIDRLASQGVSFTEHFTAAVPCSPSRASLLTGTYTTQNKVFQNIDWLFFVQQSLDSRIPTVGHIFSDAGYQTPYRGKWHLTRAWERSQALRPYGFEGWTERDPKTGRMANCGEDIGGRANCGKKQDGLIARMTADWLLDINNHKKPWLMVSSLVNPHDICEYPVAYPWWMKRPIRSQKPPGNWDDDLSTKPGIHRDWTKLYARIIGKIDLNDPDAWRRYLDFYIYCIEQVDEHIGTVLDALEKSGQKDNTIVVFTSDHGEMAGSHKLRVKGPFAYEEVMNVPLIVSWPGHIPKGVKSSALTSNIDILPTIASMTGVTNLPYLAGKDFSSALTNPKADDVRNHIIYHMNANPKPPNPTQERIAKYFFKSPSSVRCIRTRDWKYAQYFLSGTDEIEHELYNLKDDPLEMTNLANDNGYRARRNELLQYLTEKEHQHLRDYENR